MTHSYEGTTLALQHYYDLVGSPRKLPLLMVNPKNDPFLAGDCYPVEFAKKNDYLFLEMPESGGHCGFITLGNNLWRPAKRALDFLTPLIK